MLHSLWAVHTPEADTLICCGRGWASSIAQGIPGHLNQRTETSHSGEKAGSVGGGWSTGYGVNHTWAQLPGLTLPRHMVLALLDQSPGI